ncbi:TM2 domain-containing protein [Pseudobutyrivibrio ruminis]|uniref:TM2 domain-containing protein n=1 Tax=Pseudobutyrivibrio ruminis TaxID=46206 RepID=UPI00051B87DA|nr:TM2 domain-containing protein [Pseudobutyrivibrio ruminis]
MIDKYRYNEDGSIDIRRKITTKIGPFQTFYEIGEAYFPCMTADGDSFFTIALSTGLLGGHKFYTGNYLQGILYALTFGLLGVGYLLDLIMILTGSYSYLSSSITRDGATKVRTYSMPLENKKKALLCTLVAVAGCLLVVKFMYWPLVVALSETLSNIELSLY